ncbi:glycerophosphodiester phosphodiesterase [Aestuariimicrobium ganziense]|uniref:glycerophosphodiester phosphodiesterase n=1 Tax=Aestuariimicrobium ganziense TaxID=2773677 RepID=UPI0019407547|nr:glycerophosphodiester phosphodiesterase [Aestuariimicrobium ganziense]
MTTIWAHRGASADAPENTLSAFELAVEQGADGVELDVQLTSDGEVVVCHDETIDRTSDGSGAIATMTLDELRRHDFSNGMAGYAGTTIPTLREVYELLAPTGMVINVELKNTIEAYPGLEEAVEALTATMNLTGRVVYSSFNHLSLRSIAGAGTQVRLAALHQDMLCEPWRYAADVGLQALHPYWGMVIRMPEYVEQAHALGLAVNVWTVDEPEHLRAVAAAGVDAIITNVPARAREVLAG